jgi:hypothetical protein
VAVATLDHCFNHAVDRRRNSGCKLRVADADRPVVSLHATGDPVGLFGDELAVRILGQGTAVKSPALRKPSAIWLRAIPRPGLAE